MHRRWTVYLRQSIVGCWWHGDENIYLLSQNTPDSISSGFSRWYKEMSLYKYFRNHSLSTNCGVKDIKECACVLHASCRRHHSEVGHYIVANVGHNRRSAVNFEKKKYHNSGFPPLIIGTGNVSQNEMRKKSIWSKTQLNGLDCKSS